MPVQLPVLTKEQQDDIVQGLQVNALYPVTFQISRVMTNGNFPTADAAGGGRYVQLSWVPKNSIGIAGITTNIFQIGGTAYNQVGAVSLVNSFSLKDQSPLTNPYDTGNILDKGSFNGTITQGQKWFLPSTYYIQSNSTIYVYMWIETAAIGSGNTYYGSVTLHTIQTGILS